MIYEKFLMSAWIGDQSKLFGTSREPSERNFYVGISKVNNKIIRSFFTKILNKYLRSNEAYLLPSKVFRWNSGLQTDTSTWGSVNCYRILLKLN